MVDGKRHGQFGRGGLAAGLCLVMALVVGGCATGPHLLSRLDRRPIDRKLIEYPGGLALQPYITNLTAPTAICFDEQGTLFVAEGGYDGDDPSIYAFRPDGSEFRIYPKRDRFWIFNAGFHIDGPIGGMAASNGHVYVSHRDSDGLGVITAFDLKGSHYTVVADLPARGDYGVTDVVINPINGRLYFGVGTATNSGVVGMDNWREGWLKKYPKVCDRSYVDLKLHGRRFDTPNPFSGLFGGKDISVTAPFQPFGVSNQTTIRRARDGKPNGAIYSIDPGGGEVRVEAFGIHDPRGLAFNAYNRLYMTNTGMELRGTRPVKDDPDALLWVVRDTWYGWPDFSADLRPISDPQFQPPLEMILKTGYPDLSALIDHEASGLLRPDRATLLAAVFPSLSGAAKFCFVPSTKPWSRFGDSALVALSGDRAPFATGGPDGLKLAGPTGYKVVRVNMDSKQVSDFVHNTQDQPAHLLENAGPLAMERPIDVKYNSHDNCVYILDFGRMRMRNAREQVTPGTGKIYRLTPLSGVTRPARIEQGDSSLPPAK